MSFGLAAATIAHCIDEFIVFILDVCSLPVCVSMAPLFVISFHCSFYSFLFLCGSVDEQTICTVFNVRVQTTQRTKKMPDGNNLLFLLLLLFVCVCVFRFWFLFFRMPNILPEWTLVENKRKKRKSNPFLSVLFVLGSSLLDIYVNVSAIGNVCAHWAAENHYCYYSI